MHRENTLVIRKAEVREPVLHRPRKAILPQTNVKPRESPHSMKLLSLSQPTESRMSAFWPPELRKQISVLFLKVPGELIPAALADQCARWSGGLSHRCSDASWPFLKFSPKNLFHWPFQGVLPTSFLLGFAFSLGDGS